MHKAVLIFCLGVFIFPLGSLSAATLNSEPREWDFGKVNEGELLEHDFVLRNESADLLEITNIHTSCGCISAQAQKKSLLPNGSTLIRVALDTKGYGGKPVKQFAYVHTDSADLSILKYTVKAEVAK